VDLGKSLFHHNSPGIRARELFKPSKDMESLVVSIFKKWEGLDVNFTVGDVMIRAGLGFLDGVIRL